MKAKYEELDLETLNSDFFDLLENSDLQIYWPYSDNWNGLDKPIIVCGSEDDKLVYIFKGNNNETDTISFTKEFIKQNTVWVISENSTPYDELPNFYKDEFINKDNAKYGIKIVKTEYIKDDIKTENKEIKHLSDNEEKTNQILEVLKRNEVTPIGVQDIMQDLLQDQKYF